MAIKVMADSSRNHLYRDASAHMCCFLDDLIARQVRTITVVIKGVRRPPELRQMRAMPTNEAIHGPIGASAGSVDVGRFL
jgi:hypothetical protein